MTSKEYVFTTCGATGAYGATAAQTQNAYIGTNLEGKVTNNAGIQEWTVPVSGLYEIEAYGAKGGDGALNAIGGSGAIMKGTFRLFKGTTLRILVGHQGITTHRNGGGGGGTYVATGTNTPLIVAGGGGGARGYSSRVDGRDATITNKGDVGGNSPYGGGGGGFSADAANGGVYSPNAKSFLNGGVGGYPGGSYQGSFGGGGYTTTSASESGGGGGGYSGGNGGVNGDAGYGGGSYNGGDNQENRVGNRADGKVIITLLTSGELRVLIKDGDKVKTIENGTIKSVCEYYELDKTHFITKGFYSDQSISKDNIKMMESETVELMAYFFDTYGELESADYKPKNLIREDNTVKENLMSVADSKIFFFGEGTKPGDGSKIRYVFDKPCTVNRIAVSSRNGTYDMKIKDLRVEATLIDEEGNQTTHVETVTLPNDDSWTGNNVLTLPLSETIEGVTTIDVFPESVWENPVQGLSNITFSLLQFFAPDDIRYKVSTFINTDSVISWEYTGNSQVFNIPVLPDTWKSGGQNSWKGKPTDYFVVNDLNTRIRAYAYDPTGKEIARSNSEKFTPYKWVSYGLPIIDRDSLAEKMYVTHGENVTFSFDTEHQQVQKDKSYKYTVKNLTKDEVIHTTELVNNGENTFNIDFLESDHLINGDNILRVYVEDEDGHGTYEDIKVRKYVSSGVSYLDLGTRYSTKALEIDFNRPVGTDIRVLMSTDETNWRRFNVDTGGWDIVDKNTIATNGMYVDEVIALKDSNFDFFEAKRMYIMIYMSTTDPWIEPTINEIKVLYDSNANVRYFFNVDDEENVYYYFKDSKWVKVESDLETANNTHKGNSTSELMNITPDQWDEFPLGDSKVKLCMLLYTNDRTRTPIIRSIILSDVHIASTKVEAGELRLFDGYYYSPILDMEYICQWESMDYSITANATKHEYILALRTHTGTEWTDWVEVTPTTSQELFNLLPEGYKLQFRLFFSTNDKITSPKLLPTVKITYRISSKEILDASLKNVAEDLKQTKISLANLEFKHHATAIAHRYNLNNMVIENFNDTSEVQIALNARFTGTSYELEDSSMDAEIRLTPIPLPYFATYVMIHAIHQGDVLYEVSFDGVDFKPISLQEKVYPPENATEVYVRLVLKSGGLTPPKIEALTVMY